MELFILTEAQHNSNDDSGGAGPWMSMTGGVASPITNPTVTSNAPPLGLTQIGGRSVPQTGIHPALTHTRTRQLTHTQTRTRTRTHTQMQACG